MVKSFSQVKLDFDKKYSTTIEFDIFLPEHLTVAKKTTLILRFCVQWIK